MRPTDNENLSDIFYDGEQLCYEDYSNEFLVYNSIESSSQEIEISQDKLQNIKSHQIISRDQRNLEHSGIENQKPSFIQNSKEFLKKNSFLKTESQTQNSRSRNQTMRSARRSIEPHQLECRNVSKAKKKKKNSKFSVQHRQLYTQKNSSKNEKDIEHQNCQISFQKCPQKRKSQFYQSLTQKFIHYMTCYHYSKNFKQYFKKRTSEIVKFPKRYYKLSVLEKCKVIEEIIGTIQVYSMQVHYKVLKGDFFKSFKLQQRQLILDFFHTVIRRTYELKFKTEKKRIQLKPVETNKPNLKFFEVQDEQQFHMLFDKILHQNPHFEDLLACSFQEKLIQAINLKKKQRKKTQRKQVKVQENNHDVSMEIESSTKCVDSFKLKEINDDDKVLDLS